MNNDPVIGLGMYYSIRLSDLISRLDAEGYLAKIERKAPEWGSKWVNTANVTQVVLVVKTDHDMVYVMSEGSDSTLSYTKGFFFQRFKPLDK